MKTLGFILTKNTYVKNYKQSYISAAHYQIARKMLASGSIINSWNMKQNLQTIFKTLEIGPASEVVADQGL